MISMVITLACNFKPIYFPSGSLGIRNTRSPCNVKLALVGPPMTANDEFQDAGDVGPLESKFAPPLSDLSGLHPFCRALLARWEAARAESFAPSWRALDLIAIKPAATLAHCTLVERMAGEPGFVYRFFGTWHVSLHGRDLTGKAIDVIRPASHPVRLKSEYLQTVAARRPLAFHFDVPVLTGTRARRETIRLPLSDNGIDIDAILGATVFVEGEKDALAYFRGHQRDGI